MSGKTCARCKEHLPHENFCRNKQQKDGYDVYCRSCRGKMMATPEHRATQRAWHHKNKIQVSHKLMEKKYGMSWEDYTKLYEAQGGRCKICGTDKGGLPKKLDSHIERFAIDHDHHTGEVRGLLCNRCNRAIGMFEDNPELLNNAVKYLQGA